MKPITSILASLALFALTAITFGQSANREIKSTDNLPILRLRQAGTTLLTFPYLEVLDNSGNTLYTINATTQHVLGEIVSYNSWLAASTNNVLAFPNYTCQNVIDRLQSLVDLGNSFLVTSNHLDTIAAQLPAIFPTMSFTDQTNMAAIWRKYAP